MLSFGGPTLKKKIGHDQIPQRILIDGAEILNKPLTTLYGVFKVQFYITSLATKVPKWETKMPKWATKHSNRQHVA